MLALVGVLLFCGSALANQYDPHLYPNVGPYFEGWYIRMMDHDTGESYAALFGQVLPEDASKAVNNTLVTILRTDGPDGQLQSFDAFPEDSSVKVTVKGDQPVTADPEIFSPPHFEWRADPFGFTQVLPDHALINFTIGDVSLTATIGPKHDWMYNGDFGPEGWVTFLPLPLAWFVYSTASEASYHFVDRKNGIDIRGKATAHMEKNWGRAFPQSWFWTEGHRTDGVTFAMSGGPLELTEYAPAIMGHLIGYENKDKDIALNFRPDNSMMTMDMNECNGAMSLTVTSPFYKLMFSISAPDKTFSPLLYGPSVKGFRMMCEESFQATASIRVYKLTLKGYHLIDEQMLEHCALEFGGQYMCIPYVYDRK